MRRLLLVLVKIAAAVAVLEAVPVVHRSDFEDFSWWMLLLLLAAGAISPCDCCRSGRSGLLFTATLVQVRCYFSPFLELQ